MLTCKRPGSGLEPRYKEQIIGMAARRNISKNTILQWEDLAPIVSPGSVSENNLMEQDVAAFGRHPMKKRHA